MICQRLEMSQTYKFFCSMHRKNRDLSIFYCSVDDCYRLDDVTSNSLLLLGLVTHSFTGQLGIHAAILRIFFITPNNSLNEAVLPFPMIHFFFYPFRV